MELHRSWRHGAIFLLILFFVLIAACSKEGEEGLDKIAITPVPKESASPSPPPAPKAGVPLNPLEVWCESMMAKANGEWTKEEAVKFSEQCLYDE